MDTFNIALNTVLTFQPLATASLAAIGLATVFYLLWQLGRPLGGFLVSTKSHMLVFWCAVLIVTGATLLGVGNDINSNSFRGAGISSGIIGIVVMVIYWLRKWIKWNYRELEDY